MTNLTTIQGNASPDEHAETPRVEHTTMPQNACATTADSERTTTAHSERTPTSRSERDITPLVERDSRAAGERDTGLGSERGTLRARLAAQLAGHAPSVEKLLTLGTICTLIAAWFLLTRYGLVNPLFLPGPGAVWDAFITTATTGYQGSRLDQHLFASLQRVLAGWSLACAAGIPLGFAMGFSSKFKAVFDPVIEFYRPLPPLGLYTLIVMWLGIGEESKITLLFLAALPPITISATEAVAGIDRRYLTAVQSLGATRRQLLRHVIVPACLPGICTGMRISLGFTYSVLVAAEIVAATRGLGWMVWDAAKFLLSDVVIMGLIVLGLTGLVLDLLLRRVERALTPWRFI